MRGQHEQGRSGTTERQQHQSNQSGVSLVDFHTRHPEEARTHALRYGDSRRVVHGREAFLYSENAAVTGRITVGHMHRSFRHTLSASVLRSTLFLTLCPGETIRFGRRRTFDLVPSRAVVSPAGWDYTLNGFASEGLGVSVEAELLESEIEARLSGRSRRWLVQPVQVAMSNERRAEVLAMLAQLRNAACDGDWGRCGSMEAFERAAAGWMAQLLLEASGIRAVTDGSLHRLARLSGWVDAHLAEDLTLDRLCAVTGMSWRALQKAMLAVHGQTPLEFVNARRLVAARRLLQGSSSQAQIATIALDCGFRHLGRFAAAYRTAFGELPSETTRATRGAGS